MLIVEQYTYFILFVEQKERIYFILSEKKKGFI